MRARLLRWHVAAKRSTALAAGATATTVALVVVAAAGPPLGIQWRRIEALAEPAATTAAAGKPWWSAPNPSDYAEEPLTKTRFPQGVLRESASPHQPATLFRLGAVSVRVMMNLSWLEYARAYAFAVYLSPRAMHVVATSAPSDAMSKLNPVPDGRPLPLHEAERAFVPSASWRGPMPGYVFTRGDQGLGYYMDDMEMAKIKANSPEVAPECMLRLVMLRDVDGEHLAHGFEKSLVAREAALGVGIAARHEFAHRFMMLGRVPKGTALDFYRNRDGHVVMVIDGKVFHEFSDPWLGWALVDAFLGPNGHLDAKGKADIVTRAADLYRGRPLTEF